MSSNIDLIPKTSRQHIVHFSMSVSAVTGLEFLDSRQSLSPQALSGEHAGMTRRSYRT
jgi:hypothetical protein